MEKKRSALKVKNKNIKNKYKKGGTKKYQAGGTSKYQGGDMYGSNNIPNAYTPNSASMTHLATSPDITPSLLKQREELGESADLTSIQENAKKSMQSFDAAAASIPKGITQLGNIADKTGLAGSITTETPPAVYSKGAEEMANLTPIPGVDQGMTAATNTNRAGTLTAGAKAFKDARTAGATGKEALKLGSTAAGWAGPQALGTAASLVGKGIEKASDDNDVTTMNAGETAGTMLKGAGYGASIVGAAGSAGLIGTAAAGTTAAVGSGLAGTLATVGATNMWNPVGWAAGIAALGAGAYGLIKRGKGRRDVDEKEGIFNRKKANINKELAAQETDNLTVEGYDFGNNLSLPRNNTPTKRQTGGLASGGTQGKELPGGVAVPLGGGAVEYQGRTHAEGGIMVDGNTEVEDKETADGVTMANGKQKQYFFSEYLKHKGTKSFAKEHKEILQNGGQQSDIDALARVQEQAAGRDPNAVQVAQKGGPKQYQNAGFNTAEEEANTLNLETDLSLFEKMKQKYQGYKDGAPERQLNRAINGINRDVPTSALLAGAGQMIPALYAFKHEEKPVEQVEKAGRIVAPDLERVNFNAERSSNEAGARAMNQAIDNTGGGPASVIARMAAHSKKQAQDMQIASAESRANTAIGSQEAQMRMNASSQNVANDMRIDSANTQIRENQRISEENSKKEALDVGFKNLAGINSDILNYKAAEREARAYGSHGIYERDKLRTSLRGKTNPSTGKVYTNEDIAKIIAQLSTEEEEKKD
tara:strand:+ start:442 stop:2724 length:2283 start_codon:yes stop_codon:yes gene_type:complete